MDNLLNDLAINDSFRTINFIKDVTAAYYGAEKNVYSTNSRKEGIIKVKHIAIYLCCKHIKLTIVKIGELFNYDHSLIIYVNKKISGYLTWDEDLKKEIKEIENIVKFKIVKELNLEKNYYYIPLNEFITLKHDEDKSIIFKGFSEDEVKGMSLIDTNSKTKWFTKPDNIRKHTNQNFYILEKK
jgi:hypothetical protein